MKNQLLLVDIKHVLSSKRVSYSLVIMVFFAVLMAIIAEFSPAGLKDALESSAGSAGLFEYLWFEDALKFLLLIVVSFGAFIISDMEDEGTIQLVLAQPESRNSFLFRRIIVSILTFTFVYSIGALLVGLIGGLVVGQLDLPLFLLHQLMIFPMCIFIIALTFFFSVPIQSSAPTVLSSFGLSLVMSFTYSFSLMGDATVPSPYNPMAFGYRVIMDQPLAEPLIVILIASTALFTAGILWFNKKDM